MLCKSSVTLHETVSLYRQAEITKKQVKAIQEEVEVNQNKKTTIGGQSRKVESRKNTNVDAVVKNVCQENARYFEKRCHKSGKQKRYAKFCRVNHVKDIKINSKKDNEDETTLYSEEITLIDEM